jgi:hypothetical protein
MKQNASLYFMVNGRQAENPYFAELYKVGFDGKVSHYFLRVQVHIQLVFHQMKIIFIDTYSKPDVPSVSVLRDINGKQIAEIGKDRYIKTESNRMEAANTCSA